MNEDFEDLVIKLERVEESISNIFKSFEIISEDTQWPTKQKLSVYVELMSILLSTSEKLSVFQHYTMYWLRKCSQRDQQRLVRQI